MKKKVFSKSMAWILSVVMIFGLFIIAPMTANASTGGHTQEEAVAWAQAQVGKYLDYDGAYGSQCVDLIAYYYQYLGNRTPGGNGCDYCRNALPSGWQRITNYSGYTPEPGDICVWDSYAEYQGVYGHVGIVVGGDSSRINTIEQNVDGSATINFSRATAKVSCFIRPDFVSDTTAPTISDVKAVDVSGESFTIQCELNDNVGVTRVWLVIYSPNGEKQFGVVASNGTFSYTVNTSEYGGVGNYAFHIYAFDAAENSAKGIVENIYASDIPQGHVMSESEAAGQTIPDGDYYIVNEISSDYFMDIPGDDFDTANGTNLSMWTWGSSIPDSRGYDCFHFEYLNNGFYKITQIGTNMCIDVSGGSLDRGSNVQMWNYDGNNAQQWSIEKTSHGYQLRPRCNAYYLDVYGGYHECGTNVRCWEGNDSKAQSFSFIPRDLNEQPVPDGVYVIRPDVSNQHFLDVSGTPDEFHEGSNVQIWKSTDSDEEEKFEIKYVGDGWYKIIETTSGLVVEVADIETDFLNEFRNVQITVDNGGKNQLWKIKKNLDGTYFIINQASGYYLDLYFAKTDNGTNVSQILYNGNSSQKWIFDNSCNTMGHDYEETVIAPTTTSEGYTLHTCKRCGHSYKSDIKPMLVEKLVNSSTISGTKITLGDKLTVNAKASGGTGDYTYAAYYKKSSAEKWSTAQSYKANATISFKPAAAVKYDVCVKVKDSKGTIAKQYFTVNVTKELINNSTLSATSVKKGSSVTITAKATGGTGKYTYGIYYKKATSEKWTTAQSYGTNTTVTIKPAAAVKYDICVKVKDSSGKIVKKYFTLTVTK